MWSELRRGPRCDSRVRAWFSGLEDDELFLSVLVIGEIRQGIERLRRRDPPGVGSLERWLADLVRHHAERILAVDPAVATEWGRLTGTRSASVVDVLMAATARVHGLTLATRNVRDVEWTGVACLNPFEAPASTR